jgi:hypothetical protein
MRETRQCLPRPAVSPPENGGAIYVRMAFRAA